MRVRSTATALALVGATALLAGGCGGGSSAPSAGSSASGTPTTSTSPTAPGSSPSSSPAISSPLAPLLLSAADVSRIGRDAVRVQPYQGATSVSAGQATLDLCKAHYASEAQRVQRLQVGYVDASNREAASEEVVYYRPGGTKAAYAEVKAAAARCPKTVAMGSGVTANRAEVQHRSASLVSNQLTIVQRVSDRGQTLWAAASYQYDGNLFIGTYATRPVATQALAVVRGMGAALVPRLREAATTAA